MNQSSLEFLKLSIVIKVIDLFETPEITGKTRENLKIKRGTPISSKF
jgi:hypothetical protein